MHGRRLGEGHPAYQKPWALEHRHTEKRYEWLRGTYPHQDKNGNPRRFTQGWLFDAATFGFAPFDEWLDPSHGPVDLNSETVARGVDQDGPAPAGYSAAATRQIGWQVACSLYELATNALLLATEDAMDEPRAMAWEQLLFETVEHGRPFWKLEG